MAEQKTTSLMLLHRLESIDRHVRMDGREPLALEARTYQGILEELSRRGQSRILPYYVKRFEEVYKKYS